MGRLICLMGKSSSGKDTLFKRLIADSRLQLKPVIPYTTRPKRSHETNGVEYYFIDRPTLQSFEAAGKVIEQRSYQTVDGEWTYCTIDDGQIDLQHHNYLLIVTIEAFVQLKQAFGDEKVVPLYITVDDGVRLERALQRERQQPKPNYEELCRRFLADQHDFRPEVLASCEITKAYQNDDLDMCLKHICDDLIHVLQLNA